VLVAAALLAIAGVTTMTPAVTDAVGDPQAEIVPPTGDLPPIPAAAYVVLDGDTGEPLASYNADQPRPVASLTKLMTARLVLDAGPLDHTATVPPLQIAGDESQAGLEPGDRVSRDELLQAMLIASAGDAARTLAVDVAGNESRFVEMMNTEAAAAGLDATRYANPDGLDDPAQHSSAADVAHLAHDLMQDPTFRHIVAAESTSLDGTELPTTNDLLGTYPGANGIKTGHTDEAGWCLAASATRDGRSIVAVVLGAPTEHARDDAARALLDYGFQRTVTDLSGAGDGTPSTNGQVEPEPADEDVVTPGHPPADPGRRDQTTSSPRVPMRKVVPVGVLARPRSHRSRRRPDPRPAASRLVGGHGLVARRTTVTTLSSSSPWTGRRNSSGTTTRGEASVSSTASASTPSATSPRPRARATIARQSSNRAS
jgi:D-alanyl-D-alanine carboxypeptidase (penicillin-binding protein 5/6)